MSLLARPSTLKIIVIIIVYYFKQEPAHRTKLVEADNALILRTLGGPPGPPIITSLDGHGV